MPFLSVSSRALWVGAAVAWPAPDVLLAQTQAADPVRETICRHLEAHPLGDAPFSFDRSAAMADRSRLPIGVFDSGIGGLTVLEALLSLDRFQNGTWKPGADGRPDFENERFIYLGDQANMPYGNYPAAGKTAYLRELILKDAIFLLGKRYWPSPDASERPRFDKPSVKAIVIACNTATAYGIEDIRQAMAAWNLPVLIVGVVEAGARGLLSSPSRGSVGVLATSGTCASGVYPRTIERTLRLAGREPQAVTQFGSSQLAAVIEGDPAAPASLLAQVDQDLRALLCAHRNAGADLPPLAHLILGCTHFPLVLPEIQAAVAQLRREPDLAPLIAPELEYVNPADRTALDLVRQLHAAGLCSPEPPPFRNGDLFFLSVPHPACPSARIGPSGALDPEYKYGRPTGRLDVEDTIVIPLSLNRIPSPSRKLLETKLPSVWKRLTAAP